MSFAPRHIVRSATMGVLAMLGTMLLSGSILGSIDAADDNAGYELTGCIEQWETTIMLMISRAMTARYQPLQC
jgi:hypothetical protein